MIRILPFGDRVLVKRVTTGEIRKGSLIVFTDKTDSNESELAYVVAVPTNKFVDKCVEFTEEYLIKSIRKRLLNGEIELLKDIKEYNEYITLKKLKPGDKIMVSKYVGTVVDDEQAKNTTTFVRISDIVGRWEKIDNEQGEEIVQIAAKDDATGEMISV